MKGTLFCRTLVVSLGMSLLVAAQSPHASAAETIRSEHIAVTLDGDRYTITSKGQPTPFATGVLRCRGEVKVTPVDDAIFGKGQMLTVTAADGAAESFRVFDGVPFALYHATLVNTGASATVLNKVPLLQPALELGKPLDQLSALGTGGLHKLARNGGSYAWMAIADPATRSGVVGGWLTHERGSGVLFTNVDDGKLKLEARVEYGCLRIEPGKSVATETFIIGYFADARLGLEAWADAVAKQLAIKLPPPPVVYCTWYDDVHRRAGSEASTAELAAFAGKHLKPWGLTCIQIDDGWQLGSKGNGPRKNFTGHDPEGPYPSGMRRTAEAIAAAGLTPGIWMLPFGGNFKDPFFEPHPDWFVKRPDGTPFDNKWGGTCLDMTHAPARDFIKGEMKQAMGEWGYRYFKLDGLYGGAGVSAQYVNSGWKEDGLGDGVFADKSKTNIEAFRQGLRTAREGVGPQSFILGCTAAQNMRTYAGAFGLVDAMRIGPDVGGNWGSWRAKPPQYGARNYHLNGRIWWCDPDPFYVRKGLTLDQARCAASWTALSGLMICISDWLPGLAPERLDIIRLCIPSHGVTARPVDLFEQSAPRIWLVSDTRPDRQRRDVLGLYNWDDQPTNLALPTAQLGLPPAKSYIAYDFWSKSAIKPFTDTLSVDVPATACRVLAIRPLLAHPFLLNTSRHVTQGILEVKQEVWSEADKTLWGVSTVVGGDPYDLRVVIQCSESSWTASDVAVSAEDQAAGVTIKNAGAVDGVLTVQIQSPVGRDVRWSARFGQAQR